MDHHFQVNGVFGNPGHSLFGERNGVGCLQPQGSSDAGGTSSIMAFIKQEQRHQQHAGVHPPASVPSFYSHATATTCDNYYPGEHQGRQEGVGELDSSRESDAIKAKIIAHPQYSSLLEAYMDCQKVQCLLLPDCWCSYCQDLLAVVQNFFYHFCFPVDWSSPGSFR